MKNAVCLITHKPNEKKEYLDFLNNFGSYDIYVIIDDNNNKYDDLKQQFTNIEFIQIENDLCINAGIMNMNFIALQKNVTGWDKSIYYFSKKNDLKQYKNIWFFEDDVYFHSEETILKIDNKYESQDILCNSSYKEANLKEWFWGRICKDIPFKPPYYCGMACALRLSTKYFNCIHQYIDKYKKTFFLEAFFPIIAKKYDLITTTKTPVEFSNIKYRTPVPKPDDVNVDYLYHPVKDISLHTTLRNSKK